MAGVEAIRRLEQAPTSGRSAVDTVSWRGHSVLDYATRIARDWKVEHSSAGFVTRSEVRKELLDRYEIQQIGGATILECSVDETG